jgi:hypothetical protein
MKKDFKDIQKLLDEGNSPQAIAKMGILSRQRIYELIRLGRLRKPKRYIKVLCG